MSKYHPQRASDIELDKRIDEFFTKLASDNNYPIPYWKWHPQNLMKAFGNFRGKVSDTVPEEIKLSETLKRFHRFFPVETIYVIQYICTHEFYHHMQATSSFTYKSYWEEEKAANKFCWDTMKVTNTMAQDVVREIKDKMRERSKKMRFRRTISCA